MEVVWSNKFGKPWVKYTGFFIAKVLKVSKELVYIEILQDDTISVQYLSIVLNDKLLIIVIITLCVCFVV